jgi:hypothetical protein
MPAIKYMVADTKHVDINTQLVVANTQHMDVE